VDISKIKYDGSLNSIDGLFFYYSRGNGTFCFLIQTIGGRRKIKIEMQPDINHQRPHIHIENHKASFAIDNGEILCGKCRNSREEKVIRQWISDHRHDLIQLWNVVSSGQDRADSINTLRSRWQYGGVFFNGEKPAHTTKIGDIIIWHDSELSDPFDVYGKKIYKSKGNICVFIPSNSNLDFEFISEEGQVQVQREISI